jgi:steroid Delta-isomerase
LLFTFAFCLFTLAFLFTGCSLAIPATHPINPSCLESIEKFHAAVIWRKVQQLLRTLIILRIIAVTEVDGTVMFASDQPNIQKEKRMRNQSMFLKKMRNQSMFLKKITALAIVLMFLLASSVTRVEAAATPDLTSEQIEAVIEEVFTKLTAFDAQGVVNHFASDAVLEDPVGTPPIQGTPAIKAYLETFPTLFSQIKLYSLDVKVCGQEAAVKWRLRFKTKTKNVFFLDGIGIFKFNQDGKIQSEREFFDLAYFLEQLQD